MKKSTIAVLALSLSISTAAQAQKRGRSSGGSPSVSLGLKAGASLTNLTGADAKVFDNRFGFHGGLFANIGIS